MSDADASLLAAELQLCRPSQDPEQGAFQKKIVSSRVHVVCDVDIVVTPTSGR